MTRLQAQNLSVGYGAKVVGNQIHAHLAAGEVVCLLGANGAGKSTLLRTLLGLQKPLHGQVLLNNKPLPQWPRKELARTLAYVPQNRSTAFEFSARESVLFGRQARMPSLSPPSSEDLAVATACLSRMGVAHLADRTYQQISGGEQQLVLIARALAQEPSLLVMDEPTASLDFANQLRVLEQIDRLRHQGLGILLCTHQPDHALALADRLLLYRQGRVVECPSTEQLDLATLAWLYDLKPEQIRRQLGAMARLLETPKRPDRTPLAELL